MKVYNTLTRRKEEFIPIKKNKVSMYVCGPTVYDLSHLGHARAYIAFDVIRRYLEYRGFKVTYVQNITNVDDKIMKRAVETGEGPLKLAERFTDEYFRDSDSLGITRADKYPKVTNHIPEIIKLVSALTKKGYAYEVGGSVYFSVSKFGKYGKLSRLNKKQIKSGSRIKVDERKKKPEDFALWKKAKPGELSWDSPWGKGRPGWHIECSAMSMKYLGQTFDIHGGGQDLIFPHHENEIAQSEAYSGKKFVNYWLHNGFVTVNKEKMAKSLGNFVTIQDILKKHDAETIRFFLLSTSYRGPIDFSDLHLKQAKQGLNRLKNTIQNIREKIGKKKVKAKKSEKVEKIRKSIIAAMDDDFNTTKAVAALFDLAKLANKELASKKPNLSLLKSALNSFTEFGKIFSIFQPSKAGLSKKVEQLITQRQAARKKKDFKKADSIRSELKKMGIKLEDQSDGSVKWRKA